MIRVFCSSLKQQRQQQYRRKSIGVVDLLPTYTTTATAIQRQLRTTTNNVPLSQALYLNQYSTIFPSRMDHYLSNNTGSCIRTFASSSPGNKPQYKKKDTKPNVKPSEAGRIVLHQSNLKKLKPGQVKLCNGCGTEVRRASHKSNDQVSAHQILAGVKANEDVELTKKQSKKARYAEATAADKGAFLCDRCKALQSDNIYRAYDALADVSPEVFSSQLKHIVGRRRYGLCIVVVDSTDPEHSAVKNLRKSIGAKTPIWLVINKIDLLPKMDHRICKQLARRIASIMDVQSFYNYFAVSSITGKGIYELAERLLQTLGGKDVFIVGCANVGKSTLVHRLAGTIATASYLKGKRGQSRRELCNNLAVTGSHLPGTTLQAVRIPCFQSDRHALWDTPGIINRKAIQYSLFPVHIMEPMARPETIPLPSPEAGTQGRWQVGYSVLIEAAWMDVDDGGTDSEDSIGHKVIQAQNDEIAAINDELSNVESVEVNDENEDDEDDDDDDNNENEETFEEENKSLKQNLMTDSGSRSGDNVNELNSSTSAVDDLNEVEKEDFQVSSDSTLDVNEENNEGYDDDDDHDVMIRKKRKAALEKKKAIIAAAKERRRLRMMQNGGSENDEEEIEQVTDVVVAHKSESSKKKKKKAEPSIDRGPCVLGRIDLTNVENGNAVFAQAFLHPALRLRIVPTDMAPDHATVATAYLKVIRQRMEEAAGRNGAVATKLKDRYSIPLKPFIGNTTKNGEIIPGDKEYNESYDSYYMDVVFASLGWISISNRGKFTVIPHCVEGSVFSKRPSLYPTNIASLLESNYVDDTIDSSFTGLSEEECMNRLRDAAREGRHAGGSGTMNGAERSYRSSSGGQKQYGGMGNDNDLYTYQDDVDDSEWY